MQVSRAVESRAWPHVSCGGDTLESVFKVDLSCWVPLAMPWFPWFLLFFRTSRVSSWSLRATQYSKACVISVKLLWVDIYFWHPKHLTLHKVFKMIIFGVKMLLKRMAGARRRGLPGVSVCSRNLRPTCLWDGSPAVEALPPCQDFWCKALLLSKAQGV